MAASGVLRSGSPLTPPAPGRCEQGRTESMRARKLLERVARAALHPLRLSIVPINSGYYIAADWRRDDWRNPSVLKELAFADHLRRLFANLRTDCVLDVGANAGQYAQFLREQVGFGGTILSFEPASETYGRLLSTAKGDDHWKVFHMGLGRENARREINLMKMSQCSSFLDPSPHLSGHLKEASIVDGVEIVEVRRLDGMLSDLKAEFGFERPYLKLDTQGFDLEVIAGVGARLAEISALQSEMSIQPIYRGMPNYREALQTLEELGFRISGMFPVVVSDHAIIEFDCVMVRGTGPSDIGGTDTPLL